MPDSLPYSAATVALAQDLAQPKPMRHGSVGERYVKCSKPGCPCATDPDARHGPYTCLTRAVNGKTQSRYLTPVETELVRQQIGAGQQFRQHVDAYWKTCEQWADQELDASKTAVGTAEAVKKKGSKRASKKKSPTKSGN